jgi:alpha-1,2-glucosyltransferase
MLLGDKSAHTATIHTPQMLYIWPYIAFFSAPLIIAPILEPLMLLLPQRLRTIFKTSFPAPSSAIPSLLSSLFWIAVGLAAVYFNTIVHPYTLADNRHYVFYVFKILLRHPAFRYMAVPVYYSCAWLTMQALGSPSNREQDKKLKRNERPTSSETSCPPCQISFIFVWLATTALSLVSAPLVEPRYFIIPWIIWRLHVPTHPASLSTRTNGLSKSFYDLRPCLETIWMLAVDAVVTYIFIRRGFEWHSEPGKVQRFLW